MFYHPWAKIGKITVKKGISLDHSRVNIIGYASWKVNSIIDESLWFPTIAVYMMFNPDGSWAVQAVLMVLKPHVDIIMCQHTQGKLINKNLG